MKQWKWSLSVLVLTVFGSLCGGRPSLLAADQTLTLDHCFAPPQWQTSICLPDDWQKTLVSKDGGLLYDYPGKYAGFKTKITFGLVEEQFEKVIWVKQELVSPRIPIVRTRKQAGALEITEEAFAVTSPIPPLKDVMTKRMPVRRVGENSTLRNWAAPAVTCDPDFRHVAVGWSGPIEYQFPAKEGEDFTVVFGLCEGFHPVAGARVLDLRIEGKTRRSVDMVKEKGKNVPAAFAFEARDENGDGFVNLSVAPNEAATDKNTILNLLWIFRSGGVPTLETLVRGGPFEKPPLARIACGVDTLLTGHSPRHDILQVTLRNRSDQAIQFTPRLQIESDGGIWSNPYDHVVDVAGHTKIFMPDGWLTTDKQGAPVFAPMELPPRGEKTLVFGVGRGDYPAFYPQDVKQSKSARQQAEAYWTQLELPYDRLVVPDEGVQALIDSSIRNIYQAREIKNGLPAFQVGPTCYRGLWVVDGSFLLEAITYLDRADETRAGIQYLLSFQRDDGSFMLIDGHWKETGIVLWAVTRHAQLTGDQEWLRGIWPKVERGFAYIAKMRAMTEPGSPNEGLIPDGFSDGGLAEQVPEYTNVYWTLVGMRAAVEAARWLGNRAQAEAWQGQFDGFYATFRRAAERDMKTDTQGNRYLPIRMAKGEGILPQKAQWAFLHAVYPGQVFALDDPLVQGNMAMLKAVESEGLVFNTGWLKKGLWNYFGSFYGHAWLWLGDGQKAAQTLFAFGNHASPLLCWREEHMPQGQGDEMVGDMPHNWASAEFIRLVRHCLALERGNELHLFEGFPADWAAPGSVTRMKDIATSFGPLSLEFKVAKDGKSGELKLAPPERNPPQRIVWHMEPWSSQRGTMELPAKAASKLTILLTQ